MAAAYFSILDPPITFLLVSIFCTVLVIFVLLPVKLLGRRYQHPVLNIFLFPLCFAGLFKFIDVFSPVGGFINPAHSFYHVDSLMQLGALGGLTIINFVVALLAAVGSNAFAATTFPCEIRSATSLGVVNASNNGIQTAATYTSCDLSDVRCPSTDQVAATGTSVSFLVVLCLLCYGGARTLNSNGQFFQNAVQDWQRDSLHALCVVDAGLDPFQALNKTAALALQHRAVDPLDVVLWSEAMVDVPLAAEERFLAAARDVARAASVLLGVAYLAQDPTLEGRRKVRNMLAVLRPNGTEVFRYQKVHPVIGVEADVAPGAAPAPVVDLGPRFGHVGAAICYDYDFPQFIRDASVGADLMLQPGWDWGPLGTMHSHMAAVRAMENGFTLFRCSSGGVSGVYGPYGDTRTEVITAMYTKDGYRTRVPRRPRVWTVYHATGDVFGFGCMAVWMLLLVMACTPPRLLRRVGLLADAPYASLDAVATQPPNGHPTTATDTSSNLSGMS
eukprot:EG_transcript_9896